MLKRQSPPDNQTQDRQTTDIIELEFDGREIAGLEIEGPSEEISRYA